VAGLQYTLTCVASVVPHTIIQPYITWLDPLGNITAEKASGTSLDLKFSALTLSAQGQYTCRVTLQFDSLGQTYTAEETVSVDVEGTVWYIYIRLVTAIYCSYFTVQPVLFQLCFLGISDCLQWKVCDLCSMQYFNNMFYRRLIRMRKSMRLLLLSLTL